MPSNPKVLPFYPASLDHATRKAKQLRNRFPFIAGHKRALEFVARAMGHPHYHALERALKAGTQQSVFDEDLSPWDVMERTACQTDALRTVPGSTPLQISHFLPAWRLTAAPQMRISALAPEGLSLLDAVKKRATEFEEEADRTYVAGELALAPVDISIPVTRHDLNSGRFRMLVQKLHSFPAYRKCTFDALYGHVTRAFGYHDEAAMQSAADNVRIDEAFLPQELMNVVEVLSWRLYCQGAGPMGAGLTAVYRSLQLCPIDVVEAVPFEHTGDLDNGHWSGLAVPGLNLKIAQSVTGLCCTLRPDGYLSSSEYVLNARDLARKLWSPDCGKSPAQVQADIEHDAWSPLEEYLELTGLRACPAGVEPVTYLRADRTIVGFGFMCAPANLYLNAVYPLDGQSLLKALDCLWRKTPVPKGLPSEVLPHSMLIVPFNEHPNLGLSSVVEKAQVSENLARDISGLEPWNCVPVTVGPDGLDMPVTFTVLNNRWKRSERLFSANALSGELDFTLAAKPKSQWFNKLVPLAFDSQSCDVLGRALTTCEDYHDQEWTHLSTDEGQLEYCEMLAEFNLCNRLHVQIPQNSYLRRFNRATGLLNTMVLVDRWPSLADVPRESLTALAVCHWHKDEPPVKRRDPDLPLFLARAVAAGLGVDVEKVYFAETATTLLSVIRLYRLARKKAFRHLTCKTITRLSAETLRLHTELEDMRLFVERIESQRVMDFLTVYENTDGSFINLGG